jgi:hypothetical protein
MGGAGGTAGASKSLSSATAGTSSIAASGAAKAAQPIIAATVQKEPERAAARPSRMADTRLRSPLARGAIELAGTADSRSVCAQLTSVCA